MNPNIIIKCFCTPKGFYVYDRHTGSLLAVSEAEYHCFKQIETGETSPEAEAVLNKYRRFGMFKDNYIKILKHPETEYLDHLAEHRMEQLVLQVTQECNLRCGYCVYSGLYGDNRTHKEKHMSFENAKKAIDFYLQRVTESDCIRVAFYGGEPLLKFDLIKQCVSYIEENVSGHKIQFNMTTNGTLLTEQVGDFLVEHKFYIAVSLDGPRNEHNINRRFRSGKGSFDVIMKNIAALKERHPEAGELLSFMTVINPKAELTRVMEYFDTDAIMSDSNIRFNQMSEVGLSQEITYHTDYLFLRKYEYLKMLAALIGKIDKKCVSRLMQGAEEDIIFFSRFLNTKTELPTVFQHGGPCLAGIRKLFVTVDGTFCPCERVNETSNFCKIGTIDTGFDLKKIAEFVNIGSVTKDKCTACWNLRLCKMCYGEIDVSDSNTLTPNDVSKNCKKQCANTLYNLYEYAVLTEMNFDVNRIGVV